MVFLGPQLVVVKKEGCMSHESDAVGSLASDNATQCFKVEDERPDKERYKL